MPKFYFDLLGEVDRPDPIGTDLLNVVSARGEAFQRGAALLATLDGHLPSAIDWQISVTDDHGCVVFRLDIATESIPMSTVDDG